MIDEVLKKFEELKANRISALALNMASLEEYEKQEGIPLSLQYKRDEALEYFARQKALEAGADYDRINSLNYTLKEHETWKEKLNAGLEQQDPGFTTYNDASFRKFNNLSSRLEKDILGPDFIVTEIQRQIRLRKNFSKRRKFVQDEDVTYINQRNFKFNKKLSRAFDSYSKDLSTA